MNKWMIEWTNEWNNEFSANATLQGYFLHKDKLYAQVDGVTMGSQLGPTLANFFLGHLETQNLFKKERDEDLS